MLAARDFGDHAAEARVEIDLGGDDVRDERAVRAHKRRSGFIARGFDGEDERMRFLGKLLRGRCRRRHRFALVDAQAHLGQAHLRRRGFGGLRAVLRMRAMDQLLDRALHDERILAIGIVPRPRAERMHAERGIERLRPHVARAHFQGAALRAEIARIVGHACKQGARDAATAPCGLHGHFEDLQFAGDDQAARIADQSVIVIRGKGHPPHAIGAPELVAQGCRAPRARTHRQLFEPGRRFHMGAIERLIGDALARERTALHAVRQVLRLLRGEALPLVLLRIRQARVHGKHQRRMMPRGIEGVGRIEPPRRLHGKQQAQAGRRPKICGKQRPERGERIGVFRERIARDQQVGWRDRAVGELLRRCGNRKHAIGFEAMDAAVGQLEAHGIHFLAHRVGHNGKGAADIVRPRIPRDRVERADDDKAHAERAGDALGGRHGDAHAREGTRAAPACDGRDIAATDASILEQRIDGGQQLRVGRAPCLDFGMSDEAHATRRCLGRLLEATHADGDELVGCIESEDVRGVAVGHALSLTWIPDGAHLPIARGARPIAPPSHGAR